MSAISRRWLGSIVRTVTPFKSFMRVAAVLALVCTAALEAFDLISTSHPGTEIGAGVIAGMLLAAGAKALHIV
jgi:hypothetical protein